MLNQNCKIEDVNNPGLAELGIIPVNIDDAMLHIQRNHWTEFDYQVNNSKLFDTKCQDYPEGSEKKQTVEPELKIDERRRAVDLEKYNWRVEDEFRRMHPKLMEMPWDENLTATT